VALCAGLAVSALASAADPLEAYLNQIRLNELLAKGLTGAGVEVGQIEVETPNTTHVALAGATINVMSPPAVDNHATGVASLIVGQRTVAGGNFQGVATGARLWSANAGVGGGAQLALLKTAMDWQLTAPRTALVNHSWGRNWNGSTPAVRESFSRVIDDATTKGQLQVVAAGNEGLQAGNGGNKTGNLSSPGYSYNALTVGATGGAGTWNRVADFSSVTQADANGVPTARLKIDIVAPGVGIRQAYGTANAATTFAPNDGTSFATPITTGVVALLHEHGTKKGFSTDPRLMRAIVMNSANKSVQNRAGVRWDQEFKANANGVTANRTSNESGAGMLDAMEAYNQYDAGRSRAYTKNANPFPGSGFAKTTGWDVDKPGTLISNLGNIYVIEESLRKGTYLTATLTWNREVDSTDADPNNWTYKDLDQLDLTVREYLTPGGQVSVSNFGGNDANLNGTSQHNVLKLSKRNQYLINVSYRDTSPVNNSAYALAWRSYAMDKHNVAAFNGDFSGDRGAYRDNGWFIAQNAVTYGRAARPFWLPGSESNWAFEMVSGLGIPAGLAQEVVRPLTFFKLTFEIGFENLSLDSSVQVYLGNLLIGTVFSNVENRHRMYFISTFMLDANQLAALTPGSFVDLSFKFSSGDGNAVYIDNVEYVPTGSTISVLLGAVALAARRRRVVAR
jgi:hypothetical protein